MTSAGDIDETHVSSLISGVANWAGNRQVWDLRPSQLLDK